MNHTWLDRCVSLNKDAAMLFFNLNEIAIMYSKIEQYITKDYEATIDFWFEGYLIRVAIKRNDEKYDGHNMVTIRAAVKTNNKYSYTLSSHLMVYDLPSPDYNIPLVVEHNVRPLIENAKYHTRRLRRMGECYLLE